MKQETRTEKQNRDDRGSGLIMVLVAVALLGLLVSVLMFVSYAGYQMRLLDRQGKDAFYSAETVLDEVNVGLQEEISDALSKSYVDLMSNYGLYSTPQQRQQRTGRQSHWRRWRGSSAPQSWGSRRGWCRRR